MKLISHIHLTATIFQVDRYAFDLSANFLGKINGAVVRLSIQIALTSCSRLIEITITANITH
eukprot:CAMPEP_0170526672 /NCGR_PEP_ID=MMETSP0209-20121228/12081_1 /TAXON_ID=665100 ORGANISM="Litonotus pictus, Strain P1" /NCGR_SAMPLE_ID=MMETSP0209 /ASSEMBLY_ACC=CAM_ASM_000301 /LENGTH=61 /DNA_ID=CAMNT_0010816629 /DNA_START=45 /DNA_END=227 /DNA_ORIENTATION=+